MYKPKKKKISLSEINESNFLDVFNLKLKKGQEKYVSHPIRSLAQAYVYRKICQPFAIKLENKIIGYVMVIYDHDKNEYNIWHLMIDSSYQGKGYSSFALKECLNYIKHKPLGPSSHISLTCHEDNINAISLYLSHGFFMSGVRYDDEIEMCLDLNDLIKDNKRPNKQIS